MPPAAYDKTWLCPRPEDRERLVDMERRLRPMRILTFGPIGLSLLLVIPWFGWWPLPLLFVSLVGFLLAARGTASARYPEYRIAAAWVVSVAAITVGVIETGGLRGPAASWLAIPAVALAVRFRLRGVVAGALLTAAVLLGLAGFDDGPVAGHYPVLIPLLVLFTLMAANLGYMLTLLGSDVQHRGEALIDPLTGMLNRHALESRVAELAEQARVNGQPIAMIVGDLDHFKSINDRFGHARGDAVLTETAYRIRAELRAYDLAYRLGGEEFLVVLPGATLAAALDVAEALRRAIEGAPAEGVSFTMSFGVSASSDADFEFAPLLAAADQALYAAKHAGRNRVSSAGESRVRAGAGALAPAA